nr:crossover junction endonuclease EME1-like [Paramormyrops kingsleyae]XP_023675201.1 crossover junction endonuclease EME1-like [Paramormyrops kingsleyae]
MGGSRLDDQSTDSSDTEDLPSCAFLNLRPNQSAPSRAKQTDVTAPLPHASCPEPYTEGLGKPRDVVMISSESDEEEITVPLAIRLKQRLAGSTSSVPAVTPPLPASVFQAGSSVLRHRAKADSGSVSQHRALLPLRSEECGKAPDFTRVAVGSSASGSLEEPGALTDIGGSSSAGGATKRSATAIRASREDALKRREAREKNQAVRKLELERQRAEKKAFADAVKALRPEECIKHMVVCVDPGECLLKSVIVYSQRESVDGIFQASNVSSEAHMVILLLEWYTKHYSLSEIFWRASVYFTLGGPLFLSAVAKPEMIRPVCSADWESFQSPLER